MTKSNATGAPQFPIDFFEHCVAMTDIEFGGNDLLQVYNTAQIKHRLNTTGENDYEMISGWLEHFLNELPANLPKLTYLFSSRK